MKKGHAIVVGILISVIVLIVGIFVGTNNKAISLEEQLLESSSAITVQEKRRVDLIGGLVEVIEDYNSYEQETMLQIVEARKSVSNGDVKNAEMIISALAESYPELKSIENYNSLNKELSVTENLIANYRENMNIQVKNYNKFYRKFPNSFILNVMGYEPIEVDYITFDTSSDASKNLFGE